LKGLQIKIDGPFDEYKSKFKKVISENSILDNHSLKETNMLNHGFSLKTQDPMNEKVEKSNVSNDLSPINSSLNATEAISIINRQKTKIRVT